ncbi:hypothetical protein [Brachybacterium sp. GPGPB12]|uniref:hypothetical protein n=1 Tax=Brachybacterium sp. GPGPB12 TaxID=3023517 RepID=UPI003134411B
MEHRRSALRWRDAAIETGWRPARSEGPLPERLATLRELERVAEVGVTGTLAPSGADDLAEVIEPLEEAGGAWPLGIEEIVLAEEPESLPGMWPRRCWRRWRRRGCGSSGPCAPPGARRT